MSNGDHVKRRALKKKKDAGGKTHDQKVLKTTNLFHQINRSSSGCCCPDSKATESESPEHLKNKRAYLSYPMSSAVSDSMHISQRQIERIRAFKCKLGQSYSTVPSRATLAASRTEERAVTHAVGYTCCHPSQMYTLAQTQIHTPVPGRPVPSSPVRSVQI